MHIQPSAARSARIPAIALAVAIASLLTIATIPAAQADPSPDWLATYNRMIGELMSPYCHGLTLADCPTKGASELRNQIQGWLKEGRSENWILDELEKEYGPSILGAPRMRGIGLLAWVVPPLVFVAGFIGVVLFLRRQTPACEQDSPAH